LFAIFRQDIKESFFFILGTIKQYMTINPVYALTEIFFQWKVNDLALKTLTSVMMTDAYST